MNTIGAAPVIAVLCLALPLFGAGCTADGIPEMPPDHDLGNTIFPGASGLIVVGVPAFGSTTGPTPTFAWEATGRRLVFLGVFVDNIAIRDGVIVNYQDNVWAWHSGLGTARDGAVSWSDGVDMAAGQPQLGSAPTPLTAGTSYTWAVWAWDDKGVQITDSSEEMYFTVE